MDLKGYHCLADLFGKLNSQEKLEDDFTTIPEGGKLKFFWEKCGHEKIDASSIIERTKQKIRRDVMRRRRNYFLVASASVAASILICISTIHFLTHSENTNLDFQAIAEQMDSQSVEEVTLITAKEQLNLDEDAFVTYSKEGKVTVNSKVIREKEEKKVKAEPEYNQLLVPAGKRVRVELSDGTRLVVNSQSKVIYPCRFNGDIRKIYAQGEVFLEVAHDKQHPFIVESEDFKLRVLGTKFNISNYKGGATNIDVMVLGTLNGIFSPIVQGTGMLLRDQTFDLQKYQQEKDKLRADMMAKTMMTGRVFASNEELDAELDNMGWSEEEHTALQTMYEVSYAFSLQGIVQMVMRKLLEILFQSASLVIDTIRTFFLIVLSILGPIAFALSVFDGLQNTLVQWLARYISVYLWLPVADLFGAMLAKIQTLILQEEMNLMADPMSVIDVDGSSAIYLIFMVIGIIGYFCVPTVSNWIVQAGGMSAYNRNVNNTTSKVTNVAGAAAGASTGNVGAVLLKK